MPVTELPTKQQYHYESFLCVGNALSTIFEMLSDKYAASRSSIVIEDEVHAKEYEKACQHLLKNALIFTQQGYEMYLRGLVCEVSPYLLIPDHHHWIPKASNSEARFSELKSVNAADLPGLCNAVCKERLNPNTTKHFGQLRELRNRLVHATPDITVSRHQLLAQISHMISCLGWPNAVSAFSQYQANSHTAILYDPYIADNRTHGFIRAMRSEISDPFTDEVLLGLDHVADVYCVHCYYDFDFEYASHGDFMKTAVLRQDEVFCGLCAKTSQSTRLKNRSTAFYSSSNIEKLLLIQGDGRLVGIPDEEDYEATVDEILML